MINRRNSIVLTNEIKIYEMVEINGSDYVCIGAVEKIDSCEGCSFYFECGTKGFDIDLGPCGSDEREDCKNVIFVKVKRSEL